MRTQCVVVATEILCHSAVSACATATLVRIQIHFVVQIALHEVRNGRVVMAYCVLK